MASIARKALHAAGEVVLTVLAAGGAACILLVLAAVWFGASVILFSTGSMTPTIPAGSAALVREVPASEVEVGDVVTVDRPNALPITHRVVAIEGSGAVRALTLRGDANPTDDPFPYSVSHVREVIFSVPGIAPAIDAAGNPVMLATVTVLMAGLVTWAFWPGRVPPGETATRRRRGRAGCDHSSGARHIGGAAVIVAAALIGVTMTPEPATAAPTATEHIVQGEVIRLTSILDTERARNLEPGARSVWIVGVEAITEEPGAVDIDLEFTADESALAISVAVCDVRWVGTDCARGGRDVLKLTATDAAASHHLDEMSTGEKRWLRLSIGLAESGAPSEPGWRTLVVRASGFGESPGIGPGGDGIPRTGPPFTPGVLVLAALLLITAGIAVLIRRPRERTGGSNG